MRYAAVVIALVLGIAGAAAGNAPLLMLDTGGHQAVINGLLYTPDGKYLVSASDDKTIRVWDWRAGKTIRTIRGETGPGDEGKIHAIALSPDGRWLAAAGQFSAIRMYDFQSGTLAGLLTGGHKKAVRGLSFSHNGRLLISGGEDNTAVIWDATSRRPLNRLPAGAQIEAVAFSLGDDIAVTGGWDGLVKLWKVSGGKFLYALPAHSGRVRSIAISPTAGTIASGDVSGEIRLSSLGERLNGAKAPQLILQNRSRPDSKNASVRGLSFSPDGHHLLAGNGGRGDNYLVRLWDAERGQLQRDYGGHDNGVYAVAISPDNKWAATAGGDNKEIHIWPLLDVAEAANTIKLAGTGRPVFSAAFSLDSGSIAWGNAHSFKSSAERGPLQFELRLAASAQSPAYEPRPLETPSGFVRAVETLNGASLMRKPDSLSRKDGMLAIERPSGSQTVIAATGETGGRHTVSTFAANGMAVVTGGGNGNLASYNLDGRLQGRFIGHEDIVWAIAPSPDGRYLVSGSGDQTVRLWNLKTRELLATLFRGTDGAWVMWTPQGFFASSPGADALVGWQINRGAGHEPDYVTAAQLRKKLNRPDIVARAIELASAGEAVREATGAGFKISDLMSQPVPKLKIKPLPPGFAAQGGSVKIEAVLGETPSPVKAIRIQVNGRQIAERLPERGAGFKPGTQSFTVPLAEGENTVAVTAINEIGETAEIVPVLHRGKGTLDERGTLYILAIGVDKYPGLRGNDLNYAGADAKSFADAMEKQAGALHRTVIKRVLVNGAPANDVPTAANIVDALEILRKAAGNDTVMLFVAGHGINDGLNYRFVPTDAEWTKEMTLRPSTVVPWHAFQEAVEGAKGSRIMFLDTCHAANAYNPRLLNESVHANILVYTAARWDQKANESAELGGGHGLFTMALVEGMQGKAKAARGEVRAESLRAYLSARVKALAIQFNRPAQDPQFYRGRDAENYLLAIVN